MDARGFYASRQGEMARQLIADRLARAWPSARGEALLGIGHAAPYLPLWRGEARACVAMTAGHVAGHPTRWPREGRGATCLAEEDALPFADMSFDRVLIIHGLEVAERAKRMLREVWRVLRDDGRLLLAVPNRTGWWAYAEATPFGHGQPYSARQVAGLLDRALFRVEARDTALFVPPVGVVPGARLLERTARRLMPSLAGVSITEARKEVYGITPVCREPVRRRLVLVKAA